MSLAIRGFNARLENKRRWLATTMPILMVLC